MKGFAAVLIRDFKELAALLYVLPALAVVCVLFAVSLPPELSVTTKPFSIVIGEGNDELIAPALSAVLDDLPVIDNVYTTDRSEAIQAVENGDALAAVILPDDIERALIYNERVAVRIYAADGMTGVLLYGLAQSAADAVNTLQTAVYEYYSAVNTYPDGAQRTYSFDRELLIDALTRSRLVSYRQVPDPYAVQLLAMLLFVAQSAGVVCVSAVTASQIGSGAIRRMRAAGACFYPVFAAKLIESVCVGLLFLSPVAAITIVVGSSLTGWKLLVASCILSLLMAPVCLVFSVLTKDGLRSALISSAVMLVLLFAGGCVYPPYLTGFEFPNPASAALSLAGWILC